MHGSKCLGKISLLPWQNNERKDIYSGGEKIRDWETIFKYSTSSKMEERTIYSACSKGQNWSKWEVSGQWTCEKNF